MQQKRCYEFQDDLRIKKLHSERVRTQKGNFACNSFNEAINPKEKKKNFSRLFNTSGRQEKGEKGEKNLESLKGINGYKSEASRHEVNLC